MERSNPPDAVQHELAWHLPGGTPHAIEVIRGVEWAQQFYPHPPLVAIVNRRDPSHAYYFRTRDEVEQFILKLREAMALAWSGHHRRAS